MMKRYCCLAVVFFSMIMIVGCPPKSTDSRKAGSAIDQESSIDMSQEVNFDTQLGSYGGGYGETTDDYGYSPIPVINVPPVVQPAADEPAKPVVEEKAVAEEMPAVEEEEAPPAGQTTELQEIVINTEEISDQDLPLLEIPADEPIMEEKTMKITKDVFGQMPDNGGQVDVYTLTNAQGASMKVLTLGGIIFELNLPDKDGKFGNVSANLETVDDYMTRSPNFGTLVGRYGNRIAKAKFSIDGQEFQLTANDGENLLHGGKNGFHKQLWTIEEWQGDDFVGLKLSLVSDEAMQGFPGTVDCLVTYKFDNNNDLEIVYTATTDKPTPINLTQHTYFNLSAFTTPTILGETMMINAESFIPVDPTLIPTGEIAPVEGTPMDFRNPTAIGERIEQVGDDPKGYDHCYVLKQANPGELTLCAKAADSVTGRTMEIWTTEPGVQFYTGNFLNGNLNAFGVTYPKNAAYCLETQHYPDSPNQPTFPNTILRPGETYQTTTVFKFGVQ